MRKVKVFKVTLTFKSLWDYQKKPLVFTRTLQKWSKLLTLP